MAKLLPKLCNTTWRNPMPAADGQRPFADHEPIDDAPIPVGPGQPPHGKVMAEGDLIRDRCLGIVVQSLIEQRRTQSALIWQIDHDKAVEHAGPAATTRL